MMNRHAILPLLSLLGLTIALFASGVPGSSATMLQVAYGSYLAGNVTFFVWVLFDDRRGAISLLVSFFFLFFIALPSSIQIRQGSFPYGSTYDAAELLTGYELVSLSQLGYIAGMSYSDRRSRTHPPSGRRTWTASPAATKRCIVGITLACAAIAAYLGLDVVLLSRSERGSQLQGTVGFKQQLLFVGRSVSLFGALLAIWYHKSQSSTLKRLPGIAVSTSVGLFAVLNAPTSLARFQLLGSLVAVAAMYVPFHRTHTKLIFALLAPLFLFFVFPEVKSIGTEGRLSLEANTDRDLGVYLTRVDFDAFKQVTDAAIYSADHDLRYGANFAGVAFFWVPRDIWSSKPVDTGLLVSEGLGYSFTNVSSPLPAEAFVSFGHPGVVVVFVLAGFGAASLERRARAPIKGFDAPPELVLYALTAGFSIIVLRGALNGVAPMFASAFFAYAAAGFYVREQGPSDEASVATSSKAWSRS